MSDTKFSGSIEATAEYVEVLKSMCSHFSSEASPSARVEAKLRCTKCLDRVTRPEAALAQALIQEADTTAHNVMPGNKSDNVVSKETHPVCFYHDGRRVKDKSSGERVWTCCWKAVKSTGCVHRYSHTIPPPNDPALSEYWRYYPTPMPDHSESTKRTEFNEPIESRKPTKRGRKAKKIINLKELVEMTYYHRKAVALDCEMGTSTTRWPEMIRISVVDYFTGDALIDSLVQPSMPMASMNTAYGSGVSWDDLNTAAREGKCLWGADAVREELFKYVGPETIVVTHSGHNDMNVIRWIHPLIADTQIQHQSRRPTSLRDLAASYCGIYIQTAEGHCSLEDTMATREVMHRMVQQRMAASSSEASHDSREESPGIDEWKGAPKDNGLTLVDGEWTEAWSDYDVEETLDAEDVAQAEVLAKFEYEAEWPKLM